MGQASLVLVSLSEGRIQCTKCKALKLLSEFYGYHVWCKECRKSDEKRRRRDPALRAKFQKRYSSDTEFRASEILRRVKKRAKLQSVKFDLDLDWVLDRLRDGHCEISGLEFDLSSGKPPFGPSVDRIIAGGGYTKDNCRVILNSINAGLMTWGLDQFIVVSKAIAARY